MGIRGIIGAALAALLLYFSGLFVWLTPLPIFYSYRVGGRSKGTISLFVSLAILLGLYFVAVPLVLKHGGEARLNQWFFWLPGAFVGGGGEGLAETLLGITYFCFNCPA